MDITVKQAYDLFIFDRETFCSYKTMQYYKRNLGFFLDYLNESGISPDAPLQDVPAKAFSGYVRYLRQKKKWVNHSIAKPSEKVLKNNTVRTYSRAVRAFLNYCNQEYESSFITAVKLPKSDKEEKVPLYEHEVAEIDAIFNLKNMTGLRDYCIVHIMLDAGLRAQEVEYLKICDVEFDKNIIRIENTKANKSRVVLLAPKLKKQLYTYVTLYRPHCPDSSVEYSRQRFFVQIQEDKYITYNVIKMLFSRIRSKTGIDRLTPHLLRHTFATSYIMGGGNLENLRLLLGHYDYTVTREYLHLANTYKLMGASIYQLDPIFFRTAY